MPEPTDIRFARLLDWAEGRLSPEEARRVEGLHDEAEVAWVRAFVRASRDTVIESPPAAVREALVERFEARAASRAEGSRGPSFLERLTAMLQFDSGLQPAYGVRSGARESQRQLIYASERVDLVLDLHPGDEGRVEVVGQVLSVDEATAGPFGFQLLRGHTDVALTATDDLGMFSLGGLHPGDYEAVITGEGFEVLISPVTLVP